MAIALAEMLVGWRSSPCVTHKACSCFPPHGTWEGTAAGSSTPTSFPSSPWCSASKWEDGWEARHCYEHRGRSQDGDAWTKLAMCCHQLAQSQSQGPACSPAPATSAVRVQKPTHLAKSAENDLAKEAEQLRGLAPGMSSASARSSREEAAGAPGENRSTGPIPQDTSKLLSVWSPLWDKKDIVPVSSTIIIEIC